MPSPSNSPKGTIAQERVLASDLTSGPERGESAQGTSEKRSIKAKPFAADEGTQGWLQEASTPMGDPNASTKSQSTITADPAMASGPTSPEEATAQGRVLAPDLTSGSVRGEGTQGTGEKRSIKAKPFAADEGTQGWLQEASTPMGDPNASTKSQSTITADPAMASPPNSPEEATAQERVLAPDLTSGSVLGEGTQGTGEKRIIKAKPFAADEGTQGWLQEASTPMGDLNASTKSSNADSKGSSPIQFKITGDNSLDKDIERKPRQNTTARSSSLNASEQPFAAGGDSQGWLEAASLPMVRITATIIAYPFSVP